MTRYKLLNILDIAYCNDVITTYKPEQKKQEKYLDKIMKEGYLENKHITQFGNIGYWITQKGIDLLKKERIIK